MYAWQTKTENWHRKLSTVLISLCLSWLKSIFSQSPPRLIAWGNETTSECRWPEVLLWEKQSNRLIIQQEIVSWFHKMASHNFYDVFKMIISIPDCLGLMGQSSWKRQAVDSFIFYEERNVDARGTHDAALSLVTGPSEAFQMNLYLLFSWRKWFY